MAGGLLNLISVGNQNVILNGTPTKSFWKCCFKRYTNFGKQNFRLALILATVGFVFFLGVLAKIVLVGRAG